jgi:protein-S-isoprenylcysteine O-methyltransferase Ste14
MTTLGFWFYSDDHVGQDQKVNVVITTGLESHRGHHYRTIKPAWSSLQDQKDNVVIIAGPESQRGPRWLSGLVVTTTWVFWSCSLFHVGFLVLQ